MAPPRLRCRSPAQAAPPCQALNTELLRPHLGLFSLSRVTQSRSPAPSAPRPSVDPSPPNVSPAQPPHSRVALLPPAPPLSSITPRALPHPGSLHPQSPHRPWRHVPLQAARISPLGPRTLPTALRPLCPHHWACQRLSPSVLHRVEGNPSIRRIRQGPGWGGLSLSGTSPWLCCFPLLRSSLSGLALPAAALLLLSLFLSLHGLLPPEALCLQPLSCPPLPCFPKGAPRTPDWLLCRACSRQFYPQNTLLEVQENILQLRWALRSLQPGPAADAQCHMWFQPTKTCSLTESVKWGRGHGLASQTQTTA